MSCDQPLVSVVMPAYNAGRFIARAIDSVITQSYGNLEIIVVDDGSTDTTSAIVEQYCREDSRIRLVRQQNQGVASARNRGIECARGRYIAPIDSDDVWYAAKIEAQVRAMSQAGESVGLVYSWLRCIDEDDRVVGSARPGFSGNVLVDLLYSNFVGSASSPLIPRQCFEEVGGYDATHRQKKAEGSEDWDLYLRIARRREFRVVPEYLVGYRLHQDSMSGDYRSMERSWYLVVGGLRDTLPQYMHPLVRWSQSNYFLYVSGKASRKGQSTRALTYLLRSLTKDPFRLLSPKYHKTFLRSVLTLILGASWSKALVHGVKAVLSGNRYLGIRPQRATGRDDLEETDHQAPRISLFDRIHSHRMTEARERWRSENS